MKTLNSCDRMNDRTIHVSVTDDRSDMRSIVQELSVRLMDEHYDMDVLPSNEIDDNMFEICYDLYLDLNPVKICILTFITDADGNVNNVSIMDANHDTMRIVRMDDPEFYDTITDIALNERNRIRNASPIMGIIMETVEKLRSTVRGK